MLFQTPVFGLFLVVIVFGATFFDRRATLHQLFLLAASYLFYGAWDPRFLLLIFFSTVLDYAVGLGIQRSESAAGRRWLLITSLVGNLGALGLFKYYGFFAENLGALLARIGFSASIPVLHLILPVGISFYTFQTLSYTIDIYRGELKARTNFIQVALFVAFFPQLVAGPIVRAKQFLPQLNRRPEYDRVTSGSGLYLILKGLIKKVVFADVIGSYLVNPVWADPGAHGRVWILLAAYGFMFQIYGDFAGYSDIAVGCGRLLGFDLPRNFHSPFKAYSPTEIWRRWHITLTSWFRDYLYFPLGGARRGFWRTNLNTLITFVLIGLWHGAAWTFVLWGLVHGLMLVLEHSYRRLTGRDGAPRRLIRPLLGLMTFHGSILATIAFRAPSVSGLREFFAGLARPTTGLEEVPVGVWIALGCAVVSHFLPERWKEGIEHLFPRLPVVAQAAALLGCLLLLRQVGSAVEPFYYFQF